VVLPLPGATLPADALIQRPGRLSNVRYTGATEAPYKFADAFALLIVSTASLADLNGRLEQRGEATVGIERFRPNLVLSGIETFEEDYIDRLSIGAMQLRVVKPCVRCSVPNVDPATGTPSTSRGHTRCLSRQLAGGRRDFRGQRHVERGSGGDIARGSILEITLAL